jgi:hypothetical protein
VKTFVASLIAVVVLLGSAVSFAADETQIPEDLVKVLNYYVGNWAVEGKIGDSPLKGKAVFRMSPGKHCILGSCSVQAEGQRIHFSLVSGWDSSTGWSTEQGLESDGGIYTLKWRKVSATVDEGELVGTANGQPTSEFDRLERKGDNEFSVTCTKRKRNGEAQPDITFVYHRVIREKKEAKSDK